MITARESQIGNSGIGSRNPPFLKEVGVPTMGTSKWMHFHLNSIGVFRSTPRLVVVIKQRRETSLRTDSQTTFLSPKLRFVRQLRSNC